MRFTQKKVKNVPLNKKWSEILIHQPIFKKKNLYNQLTIGGA